MTTHRPTFSIVISTLNCGQTLARTLQSIESQDYQKGYEVIIVDGASYDNTLEVANSYSSLITSLISEPDLGIYDAWNKGISISNGEWILFLGSDDRLLQNTLTVYSKLLESLPDHIDYVSGKVYLKLASGADRIVGRPWCWTEFRHFMKIAHVASLHRRNLFERNGLFSLKYSVCADYEFFLRIGASLNAAYIDKPLAIMSAGGVSQSSLKPILQTRKIKKSYNYIQPWQADLDFLYSAFAWLLTRVKQTFELGYK